MKFTHYLITRFNVPESRWQKDRSGQITLDEDWFVHRMNLFTTYCVPSVKNQSCSHFTWLIYCQSETPKHQLDRIGTAVQDVRHIEFRFVDSMESLVADLKTLVAQMPTPYGITSRLDNDDGLSVDFVRVVQAHFTPTDKKLIHVEQGIRYDTHRQIATQLITSGYNHFTSLIERVADPKDIMTVYGFHHTELPASLSVQQVTGGIYWLKIIHARNVRSQLKGRPLWRIPPQWFAGIGDKPLRISWLATLHYVWDRWWSRK